MLFVNEIAEIVHGIKLNIIFNSGTVDSFHGTANKNIGDAFLLAWKIPSQFI